MVSILKWTVVLVLLSTVLVASEETVTGVKKDQVWVCVQWQWENTAQEQKVNCVAWAKRDCSNRLHKEICKLGG
jgi:hypothetical protein